MKILMLTPYLPYPLLSGGQIRTYNLLKKLASKHQITLFALIKDESEKAHISELEKYCQEVRVFKRSRTPFTLRNIVKTAFSTYPFLVIRNQALTVTGAIQEELSKKNYDLIHVETFYMMSHLPELKIPSILVEQTIEYLGYENYAKTANFFLRPILNIDVNKIRDWEKHYWQEADQLIVMSGEDKKFIAKELGRDDKIAVVANGVDNHWFDQVPRQKTTSPTILSVGTFKWLPNREAVDFLVNKIWPLVKKRMNQCKLKIVGNDPSQKVLDYGLKDPNIEVLGQVEDIRYAFNSADLLLAPVFSGKGTRYKILEAMASSTPVVASKIAVEGLGVENGKHVLISNDANELAELTIKVLTDKKLWQKLSKNGKKFVQDRYDWQIISRKLDAIYQKVGKIKK